MILEAGRVVADRYIIEEKIGSGGMSVVYRALDQNLNRHVTFKVLKEDYLATGDMVERFPQEAKAAAGIDHINIAKVYDHGADGDICYIVLEYVDGVSLKDFIDKKAPFKENVILDVALQVAIGLSAAHANNIVHRDIKPQNILVSRHKPNTVKVTDFGIARAARGNTLHAGSGSMGSVHYISPEQARNGFLDHRTDIYSLGICMYEMATGKLPFDGESEVAIAMSHLNDPFPDVREINPDVSKSLVKIMHKATEKDPTMRYQNAAEMARDLNRAIDDKSGMFIKEEIQASKPERVGVPTPVSGAGTVQRQRRRLNSDEAREGFFGSGQARKVKVESADSSDKGSIWGGVKLGLVLFGIITILFLLLWFLVPRVIENNRSVTPPLLEGLTLVDAGILAGEYGLNVVEFDSEYSYEFEEGYIIRQMQTPDATLSRGDTIQVIVSLGVQADEHETDEDLDDHEIDDQLDEGITLVPNLLGQTEAAALELLRNAMLLPGTITTGESTTHAEGMIMSQTPMPHEEVERDSTVSFVISTGPPAAQPPTTQEPPAETPPAATETPPAGNETTPPAGTETPPAGTDTPPAGTDPPPEGTDPPPAGTDAPPEGTDSPPASGDTDPPPAGSPNMGSSNLTIPLWTVPEGVEVVHVVVTRQVGNEEPQLVVNDSNVHISQFPLNVPVSGTGTVTFRVFSVEGGMEVQRAEPRTINFDE